MSVRRTLFGLLLCLATTIPLLAQSSTGSISGVVIDESGAALPGVTVTATNIATGAIRTAVSNVSGAYQLALLPPGTYSVEIALSGFQMFRRDRVVVNVGTDVALSVTMNVGVAESVTVSADAPLIESDRTQVSSVVNQTSIQNLPANGRNFIDFVLTTPGVVKDVRAGDISFAGQRGTLNSLVIDGANNDNTFFGQALGRTGSGRAPYQFSQDAVQEFQVNSNAYSAEYGRAGGAVINVVTKSGTNEIKGSLFYFLRDRRYNANDYINEIQVPKRAKSPYHFDQYGASAGGPIALDRHFFFANYDAQRNDLPNVVVPGGTRGVVIRTPEDQAGYDELLTHAADYVRSQNQDVYLVKTDHELLTNAHLSLRYNRQEFAGQNYENGSPQHSVEHTGDSLVNTDTLSAVFTTTTGASFFNEVRAQWAKDQEPGKANFAGPEAEIFHDGNLVLRIGQNTFSPRETTIKRWQLADTATYLWNSHTVKAGFDVSNDDIFNYFPGNFAGSYRFGSLADYGARKPNRFLQAFAGAGTSGPVTNPDIAEYGFFVQDEWRLNPSLTLTAGLRYDVQKIAQPEVRNADSELAAAGIDTSRIPEDTNNFGPRVGLAWTPRANTVVRGGYGVFYGRTPAIMIGTAHSNNGVNVQTITFTGALIPSYPNVYASVPIGAAAPPPTIFAFDDEYENPQVRQGSLGVERGLTGDILVGVMYQSVRGEDLTRSTDINFGTAVDYTSKVSTGGEVTYRKYTTRPFTHFSRIIQFQSSARSRYDGVTVDLQKRFAKNWQARVAYTYSTVKDNKPDATAVVPGTDDAKFVSDPGDVDVDYTYGDNDVRHRVVLSGVWSLDAYAQPIRQGWLRAVASGWSISGIASYQSGQPFTPMVNSDLNSDGNSANDIAPGFRRNSERLPSQFSLDPRVTKQIDFGGVSLQMIAEAFNVLNRSNVSNVNRTYYSYNSGTNTFTPLGSYRTPTVSAGPRIMQLAAKVTF